MTDLPLHDYRHDDTVLQGRVARPNDGGKRPGVLVYHHALGQCLHDCQRAQDLADLGYVVLVCDMYGTGLRELTQGEYGPAYQKFREDPDFLRARALAGFEALKTMSDVDPTRLGAIGFCFGGQCVLELARMGADLSAVVSLHGVLKTQRPAQAGQIAAKVCVLTGALDPYAPPGDVAEFQAEMAATEADYHLTVYGQGWHGFTDPAVEPKNIPGVRYDAGLDRLSWIATTAFLAEALKPD